MTTEQITAAADAALSRLQQIGWMRSDDDMAEFREAMLAFAKSNLMAHCEQIHRGGVIGGGDLQLAATCIAMRAFIVGVLAGRNAT